MAIATMFLVLAAWRQLLWFDLQCLMGVQGRLLSLPEPSYRRSRNLSTEAFAHALNLAAMFYWKEVLCLQGSIALARLLRRQGVQSAVVIGYRPNPFVAHAWVTVDGRVLNESGSHAQRLRPLHIIE